MELLVIVIAISFPIFYLMGMIEFFRKITGNKQSDNNQPPTRVRFLNILITELSSIIDKQPNKKLSDQLRDYQKELASSYGKEPLINQEETKNSEISIQSDVNQLWENWYSNNSINLLLYIGAFLIVASASIFVGFQWETIAGTLKAAVISILTLAFLLSGGAFYNIPKIKNAGVTFTAIGSILIPLCGLAWYNFAFKDLGIPVGYVWFITSAIALPIYIGLIFYLKNSFFTYISSVATFSLILSVVNVAGLTRDFYILGAAISAFIMLFASKVKTSTDNQGIINTDLEISANITMPAVLFYALIMIITQERLNNIQGVLTFALGSVFYLLSYLNSKQSWYLTIAESLFPICIAILFRWQNFNDQSLLYTLSTISGAYLFLVYLFDKSKLKEESEHNTILATTLAGIIFILSMIFGLKPIDNTIFALIAGTIAIITAFIKNRPEFISISVLFFSITFYIFINQYLTLESKNYILGTSYLVLGLFYFVLTFVFKNKNPEFSLRFAGSVVLSFALALFINLEYVQYLLLTSLTIAVTTYIAAIKFNKPDFIYISSIAIFLSLFNLLDILKISTQIYPLVFIATSYLIYFLSYFTPQNIMERFQTCALAAAVVTPLAFGIYSISNTTFQLELEKYSLISAYAATGLLVLNYQLSNTTRFAYLASVIGLFTFLWQMKFLGVEETQAYTLPIAIYFMILAYIRRISEDIQNQNALDFIGLMFLTIPTLTQSFGINGAKYALLFGVYGIILLFLGNSLKYKTYIYAGVFAIVMAVVSQTYEYALSLPRWIITGAAGTAFLGIAIYLMIRRKDEK